MSAKCAQNRPVNGPRFLKMRRFFQLVLCNLQFFSSQPSAQKSFNYMRNRSVNIGEMTKAENLTEKVHIRKTRSKIRVFYFQ